MRLLRRRRVRAFRAFFPFIIFDACYSITIFYPTIQLLSAQEVTANDQVIDALDGRVPSEYDHRDVGAFEGLCVFPPSNGWCEECCGTFWVCFFRSFCAFFCGCLRRIRGYTKSLRHWPRLRINISGLPFIRYAPQFLLIR
jgi:hypothetical protein